MDSIESPIDAVGILGEQGFLGIIVQDIDDRVSLSPFPRADADRRRQIPCISLATPVP